MTKRISENEILELYEQWETPKHVRAHCRAVSDVAVTIASELNKYGYNLDLELIKVTGLVHDVARTHAHHEEVGYKILMELGYKDEANIVKVHMRYPKYNTVDKLNETDMICLADIVVKEDHYVGLDERIAYIIEKVIKQYPESIDRIMTRKEEIRKLLDEIAQIIGKTIDELFVD